MSTKEEQEKALAEAFRMVGDHAYGLGYELGFGWGIIVGIAVTLVLGLLCGVR